MNCTPPEALKAQRASGIAQVTYDDKTIEYRGDAEIAAAIRDIVAEINKARGIMCMSLDEI